MDRPFDSGVNSSQSSRKFGNSFMTNTIARSLGQNPKALPETQYFFRDASARRPFTAPCVCSTLIFDRSMDLALRRLQLMLGLRVVNEGHPLSAPPPLKKISQSNAPDYPISPSAISFRINASALPASIDSKRLTGNLNPLEAILTKNRGEGVPRLTPHRLAVLPFLFACIFYLLTGAAHGQAPAEASKPPSISSAGPPDIRTLAPSQPDAQLAEAKSLLEQGKTADADRVVREYIATHPNSADAHFLRGYILFRQIQAHSGTMDAGQHELYKEQGTPGPGAAFPEAAAKDSLGEFTEGAKYRKPAAFDLKIVALDYVVLGDYVDADKWLTTSLQWNPMDSDGWYWLGRAKYSENRFEEAAQSFEQFLKAEPKSVKAEDNLGLSYAGLGQTDKAIAAYQNAIAWQSESSAKDPGPFLDLGALLMDQNRAQEAVPYFLQAVAISPKESRHHEKLGQAYFGLDELQKAQGELETAVSLSPQNPRLHYLLGRVYRKEGFVAKADAEFNRSESLKAAPAQTSPTSPQP
jgi:tetratricopeptide (TPR) repeat protein